jgi:hypothetical protein
MPWFPEFYSAVELARVQTRAADQADPVGQYFTALNNGDTRALEDVWPGEVVIYDPRAGEIRGHKQLRQFVGTNQSWTAEHHVRTDTVAATCADGRAVVELLAHLEHDGQDLVWPVAVVAESPNDRSVVFRTYCSQWPVDGRRYIRPPILEPRSASLGDVVGRYGGPSGLSSSLIRLRSEPFTTTSPTYRLGVEPDPEPCRTAPSGVGKRVGGNPSRVRISYPPPVRAGQETPRLRRSQRGSPSSARRYDSHAGSQQFADMTMAHVGCAGPYSMWGGPGHPDAVVDL